MRQGRQDIKIYVEELVIVESGTYHDQVLRPYKPELRGDLLDRIDERFQKSRRFTPSLLAEIAGQFMVPDMHPRGVIEVPSGWSERRGRFILTLEIQIGTGDRMKQVVMGYTNSVGFTTRNVDHDMEFYVNNTFMLQERQIPNGRGGYRSVFMPSHSNDVLSDRDNAGLRKRGNKLYTMRPEDVYSALDAEETMQLVEDVTDLRTTLSKNAVKSTTSNRIGSRYMSRVLDARRKAIDNMEYNNSVLDVNATAQGYVQESYTSDDLFLRAMSNIRGTSTTVDTFIFDDLLKLDPEAERRTETKLFDEMSRELTMYDRDSNPTDGQEREDQLASLVQIAVPALMMETGLHAINFQVHNQSPDGGFVFVPTDAKSFVKDVDLSWFVDQFEERLIDELLYPMTADDRFDIGLQVKCRVFGEVDFTLFFDGRDMGRYVFPCFCNSLMSPIVTDDRADVRHTTRQFNDLFDEILSTTGLGANQPGRGFSY
uniref:Uncharacterized protein n=1 Tax=Burkholderia phage vB_BgluM-SURPRISE13 TaxID=3159457 RepID=A0AAU7PF16_9VIRU